MTSKTLDWLNSNRFRAYPFVNDAGLVYNGSRIPDCVLLDCLIMDTRKLDYVPELVFTKIVVAENSTTVFFIYSGISTSYTFQDSSSDDIVRISGVIPTGFPEQFVHLSLTFSSHSYIKENSGTGTWEFHGTVIPSKVMSVPASGVSGLVTNGSRLIQDAGTATGDVHLKDGFRTQPVIQNGKVLVKVGTHYGYDPCHYKELETSDSSSSSSDSSSDDPETSMNCKDLLFFFCGQNAINSGNVVLAGGPGVSVTQGSKYVAKEDIVDTYGNIGISKGEEIPCIEIIASSELINLYRPSTDTSDSSSDSSS